MGMLLTPPDVISQTLLALPMWLLFEVGLVMGRPYLGAQTKMSDAGSVPSDNDTRKSKSLRPLRELLGFLWPHKGRLIIARPPLYLLP